MRRWDGLVDGYVAELRSRGLAETTIDFRRRELIRFGVWLKARRPRVQLEQVDADRIVQYVQVRSTFHTRTTVAGVMSSLRNMGEFLVAGTKRHGGANVVARGWARPPPTVIGTTAARRSAPWLVRSGCGTRRRPQWG